MKKYQSVFLGLFLGSTIFISCQHAPIALKNENCRSDRNPAGVTCQQLFDSASRQVTHIEPKVIKKAFADVAKNFSDQNNFKLNQFYMSPIFGGKGEILVHGKYLAQKNQIGSRYTQKLKNDFYFVNKKMSAEDINDKNLKYVKLGDAVFLPQKQLEDYYIIINQKIEKLILSGKISATEAIWPALVFIRTSRDGSAEFKTVRPGIDPLPDPREEWMIDDERTEMDQKSFAKAVSMGHLPLPAIQFYHDIGHFIDLIESPQTMALWRKYNAAKYAKFKQIEALKLPYSEKKLDQINTIEYYLNEFLFLPNRAGFEAAFGPIQVQSRLTKNEARQIFTNLSPSDTLDLANKLITAFEKENLVDRFGGAAHDGAYLRYMNDSKLLYYLKNRLAIDDLPQEAVSFDRDSVITNQFLFLQEDFPGLINLLKLSQHFYGVAGAYNFNLMTHRNDLFEAAHLITKDPKWLHLNEHQQNQKLIQTLQNIIAEIYHRGWWALKLELTPASNIEDLNIYLSSVDQKSDRKQTRLYKFFSEVSPPRTSVFSGLFLN